MKKILNSTVAVLTFTVGVFAVTVWWISQHAKVQKPENVLISASPSPVSPQNTLETEEYAVYSALINGMYVEDGVKMLVISEETHGCMPPSDEKVGSMRREMEDRAIKDLSGVSRETIDDFRAKGKQCRSLARRLDVPVKYVIAGREDVEPLFPEGEFDRAWSKFYAKYPSSSGIINFSNIGFNREMTQAIVSTGRGCGGLCGAGYFVLLTKKEGIWTVVSKVETWVS